MVFSSPLPSSPALQQIVDPDPLRLSPSTTVPDAIALMLQSQATRCEVEDEIDSQASDSGTTPVARSQGCALVVKDDRLVGVFTEQDVVKLLASERAIAQLTLADVVAPDCITLPQATLTDTFGVLNYMREHRVRYLPIVDGGGVPVGLVTLDNVRQSLRPENMLRVRQVSEIMTQSVIYALPDASLLQVAQQMARHGISCIVIATEEELARDSARDSAPSQNAGGGLRPVGILTERDMVQFHRLELDFATTPARAVMSTPVVCLRPEDSLWQVQQAMQGRRVRRVVVKDDRGALVGLVTQSSLLAMFNAAEMGVMIHVLQQEVDLKTQQLQQTNQQLEVEVAQRRATEAVLLQMQSDLEQRVAERTAALTEMNLRLQQEMIDRQQAEQKIREQAALLDIANDAIFVRDLEAKILYWNKGAERMYGWSQAEAIGQNVNHLLYRDPMPLQNALDITLQQGAWQGDLHKCNKLGEDLVVESRWTLVRTEAGAPRFILTVDTDITERKLLEAQFLRAQRLESLGTLASGIAHDLNNILTPVLAVSQLLPLRLPNLDEPSQRLLTILRESAQRGSDLVAQILSFARGGESQRSRLQIATVLNEVARIAKQTFPKSIEIRLTGAKADLWAVLADSTQLHQVLMNLIVNARDAMPEGGILTLSAENVIVDESYARMHFDAAVGSYIAITVMDTGLGIAPELLDRIFEPFFTTKEMGKGTGLGLSTAIGIIKGHGGFVNVYSDVGHGTRFTVYLPAATDGSETVTIPDLQPLMGNGEWILVADDEAAIREITKASLEAYNYRVMLANDGVDAIALYAENKAEVFAVLLDIMMPLLDAPTVIRTLVKMNPNVQIITMSGLAANEAIAHARTANVRSFLAKPFTAHDLLSALHQLR
ncbi:CBS domain-containing protein [Alkalinema sp. FACHB-956]|uniref:CBS domain-containing protein n=1 Tax=Alkalinema sp. FACHB-956 TaxID=2692768 RepID=UPI001681F212|nr:CBS domain-containing protein [Alkalinema sp. FACHB-956]MBD2329193.1 CBS domain-containing protein [Alkalinema sp. FACHB-956]